MTRFASAPPLRISLEDETIRAAPTIARRAPAPLAAVLAIALAVLLFGGGRQEPNAKLGNLASIRTGCMPGADGAVTSAAQPDMRVALTFDDGPGAYTPRVLRALRRSDARATFFVIGTQVEGREGLLRRMLRDGHEIGNHSMLHTSNPDETDMADASAAIEGATGFRPCQFRPPGGVVDDELVQRADTLGMSTVLWSVDPGDWQAQEPAEILDRVVSVIEPGSVVLLHDGGGDRSATAEIAPQLIGELRDRGFELVTVTRLFGGRFTIGDPPQ